MSTLEILAPAGSFESLEAAVNNGANAVYLGLDKFSARAKAENFNIENLKKAIDYCHLFDCKVYITVNTLIKDSELEEAVKMIINAYNLGADAFIVQDLGLIHQISSTMPGIVLHGSTQMGIHNLEGVLVAEKLGLKRVVLARETLLADIRKIKENSSMELEFFVQGAQCVAFSGNCYFSSLVSGYSGNRGKCLQLCRKRYTLNNDNKSLYHLSTKDLSLTKRIAELIDCGISSFKIEGRMRRAEYVGESVRIFKLALIKQISSSEINKLKQLFNRGDYCEAHLDGTSNIIFNKLQNHSGLKIGKVKKIIDSKAYLDTVLKLNSGDGVKFIRNGEEVGTALISENNSTSTSFVGSVSVDDDVSITTNTLLNSEIMSRKRFLEATIVAKFNKNNPPKIFANYRDIRIMIEGAALIAEAKNAPTSLECILENLSKTGGTHFKFISIDVQSDSDIFIAKSEINSLRRKVVESLENAIIHRYNSDNASNYSTMCDTVLYNKLNYINFNANSSFIQISELAQISDKLLEMADFIVYSPRLYSVEDCRAFHNLSKEKGILSLPIILRGRDVVIVKDIISECGIKKFIVNNLSQLELTLGSDIILGHGINLLNSKINLPRVCSIESDKLIDESNVVIYAHGFMTLMTLTHCPREKKCSECSGDDFKLKDEKNFTFTLRKHKLYYCYHQMQNDIPFDLSEEVIRLSKSSFLLDLSRYSQLDAEKILIAFKKKEPLKIFRTKGNIRKELK